MAFYCGIDLGSRHAQICVIDNDQKRLIQRKVENSLETILPLLEPYRTDIKIVVESTFNWYWLIDGLQEAGYDICLAHVLGLAAITAAKVKTDKRDAFALAKLLRMDAIPKAFIYPQQMRAPRDLLRRRSHVVRKRADEYGAIRRTLLRYGILEHTRHSTQSLDEHGLESLFDHPMLKIHARHQIERIELYTKQIGQIEAELLADAWTRPQYRHLQTLPGVSLMLGLTILYETGPISRFANARRYSSYCRVISGVSQSSGVTRSRGRQSKQGNPYLKWAFNQAAVHAVRHYPAVRKCFDRHLSRHAGRAGKVISYNTIAHKIAVAAFHVLRDGVKYKEELLFGV